MAANGQVIEPALLDDIINRLLEFRNARTARQVLLSEAEIRSLCTTSREIFLQQPNLLELEAPIKICGTWSLLLLYMLFTNKKKKKKNLFQKDTDDSTYTFEAKFCFSGILYIYTYSDSVFLILLVQLEYAVVCFSLCVCNVCYFYHV